MRYSADIPWVEVQQGSGGWIGRCTVCGETRGGRAGLRASGEISSFAMRHRAHTAPAGSIGLGDVVAAIAKPIAALLGRKPCTPCEARRRALNRARIPRPW
jgi:hypothetical protein